MAKMLSTVSEDSEWPLRRSLAQPSDAVCTLCNLKHRSSAQCRYLGLWESLWKAPHLPLWTLYNYPSYHSGHFGRYKRLFDKLVSNISNYSAI